MAKFLSYSDNFLVYDQIYLEAHTQHLISTLALHLTFRLILHLFRHSIMFFFIQASFMAYFPAYPEHWVAH